ncbi:MAG: MarR family transcriptional regulator [Gammaproteobacteria bacterium]|nr:MarR family transcriptional regulator [Gammaproteobacteria bacterium]
MPRYELQPTARLMLMAFRRFEDYLSEQLHARGFTNVKPSHFNILRHLNPEGMRQVDLARDAGITKQAVGKMVGELIEEGFISIEDDVTDRRAKKVVYTETGLDLVRQSVQIVKALEIKFSEILGIESYANLRTGLVQIMEYFSEEDEE